MVDSLSVSPRIDDKLMIKLAIDKPEKNVVIGFYHE